METKTPLAENQLKKENDVVRRTSSKRRIIFDMIVLVIYLVATTPTLTGIGVHEWFSLGVLVMLFAHLASHADWMISAVRHILSHPSAARTGNLVLNILILLSVVVCAVSGIMISGAVLPTLGFVAPGYFFWSPLHAAAAKVLLALLLLHVVLHAKWFMSLLSKKGKQNE